MKASDLHYRDIRMYEQHERLQAIDMFQRLSAEFGCAEEGAHLFQTLSACIESSLAAYEALIRSHLDKDPEEPDSLEAIRRLRPAGPRRLAQSLPSNHFDRLRGALYGRAAGCTLGAALEFRPVSTLRNWADYTGTDFPPTDYWRMVLSDPEDVHYLVAKKRNLTRGNFTAVPPDDDLVYTLLGLLTMETCGLDFTQEQMAQLWMKHLPIGPDDDMVHGNRACWWGERSMLVNLLAGVPLPEAGLRGNPNLQNIAAWTRADSYGYACPGWPEKAAALAYRDASVNHRRNGVYGSMFMAATIAAAFVLDDPLEAVRIGLTEIPENCLFAEGIRWALEQDFRSWQQAHDRIWERYRGMFNGSALTNAVQVVAGLMIGQQDFTRVIGETVAMGGDNDCTGATAGSILGAVIGHDRIPAHWITPFQGRMQLYLKDMPDTLALNDICRRFEALALRTVRD